MESREEITQRLGRLDVSYPLVGVIETAWITIYLWVVEHMAGGLSPGACHTTQGMFISELMTSADIRTLSSAGWSPYCEI